ncbi:hypothetical protein PTKIN_Ptkin14bG0120200 [Pterospermum kingtungense]
MDTRQQMIDKGHAILKKLEDNCLLENAGQGYSVKMHDAVRDMALSIITSKNPPRYMIKTGMQLESLPKEEEWAANIEKVSLMWNSIPVIPIHLSPPKCQLLTTLLLQRNPIRSIPYSFFANMPCLSVLNLSETMIEIEEVPEGVEMLVNLRYLDLSLSRIKEVPAGVLPKLSRLQRLRLYFSAEERSIKAENVVPLQKLESFVGHFKGINELKKFVQSMLLSDISCLKHAVDLKNCTIFFCRGIESVPTIFTFSSSSILFQSLKKLTLEYLPRLSEVIKVEGLGSAGSPILAPPTAAFSHLKQIHIPTCSNIKKLFLPWLLTNLQNLEEILVQYCQQLVEILAVATSEDDDEEKTPNKIKVNLPNLRTLQLNSLPKLKSICGKSGIMVCDSLELILVRNCPELRRIPPFFAGQPHTYASPSLKIKSSRGWWESLEWGHPDFKNLLQPLWQPYTY